VPQINIAFNGPRGSGKSTIMKAIRDRLLPEATIADPFRKMQEDHHGLTVEVTADMLARLREPTTLDNIAAWHHARNLVEGSKPKDQIAKLFEEGGELAGAVARGKLPETIDGIGDCVVVLVLLALQHGTTLEACAAAAYDTIKDRKGKMVDGVFVRDCE
jgi:NTP pyrophosphatase (non-canonical NTP hydrolase)